MYEGFFLRLEPFIDFNLQHILDFLCKRFMTVDRASIITLCWTQL